MSKLSARVAMIYHVFYHVQVIIYKFNHVFESKATSLTSLFFINCMCCAKSQSNFLAHQNLRDLLKTNKKKEWEKFFSMFDRWTKIQNYKWELEQSLQMS